MKRKDEAISNRTLRRNCTRWKRAWVVFRLLTTGSVPGCTTTTKLSNISSSLPLIESANLSSAVNASSDISRFTLEEKKRSEREKEDEEKLRRREQPGGDDVELAALVAVELDVGALVRVKRHDVGLMLRLVGRARRERVQQEHASMHLLANDPVIANP
jgi:hypothetical protein